MNVQSGYNFSNPINKVLRVLTKVTARLLATILRIGKVGKMPRHYKRDNAVILVEGGARKLNLFTYFTQDIWIKNVSFKTPGWEQSPREQTTQPKKEKNTSDSFYFSLYTAATINILWWEHLLPFQTLSDLLRIFIFFLWQHF